VVQNAIRVADIGKDVSDMAPRRQRPADELAEQSSIERDLVVQKLRDENRALRSRNRDLSDELLKYREVRRALEDLPTVTRRQYRKPKRATGDCSAIAVWSDWHYAQQFKRDAVEGVNEYGPEVADARIATLAPNTARMYGFALGLCDIDELIVVWLGDLGHGVIHEEMLSQNSMGPMDELVALRDHLVSSTEYLHETVKPKVLRVVATRGGNHSRITKRSYHTGGHSFNHEWMLYAMAAKTIKVPVEWELHDDYFATVDVKGHNVRFHHGDNVRYWGGVGGLTIPLNKCIAQWNKVRRVDLDVLGHFHQFKRQRDAVVNASLVGYDPFALSIKADYEPPGQGFLVVDREKGLVFAEPVFVE